MSIEDHKNPNGTYNGPSVLSEITGLPKGEIQSIMELVQANHRKLDSCPYHEFEAIPKDQGMLSRQSAYRCIHCGGEVDQQRYRWHELGRRPQPTTPVTAKEKQ